MPAPRPSSLGPSALLAGVFLTALAVRLGYLVDSLDNPAFWVPVVDAGAYDAIARRLAAEGELSPRLFWQPFFYPAMLALVYRLTAGSLLAAKVAQALLGAATCALVYLLGRRLVDRRTGLVAAALAAFCGPLILFEGELLATGWAAFWSVLLVLLLSLTGGRLAVGRGALLGALGALAVLTRPSFVPFLLAAWLWLVVRERAGGRLRASAAGLAAAVLAFVISVLPVALLARQATGRFGFLPGSGGLNTYIGNNPEVCETLTARPGLEWGALLELPARAGVEGYAARNRFYYRQVALYARATPGEFLAGLGAKALRFVSSRELPRNVDPYLYRGWSRLQQLLTWKVGGFGFPFGLLLPLAVVGLVTRGRRLGAPLALFLVFYPLAVVAVFVSARYRVVIVPVLSVAAAAGLLALVEDLGRRRWDRLGWAAVAVLAVLLLATLPGPFCEERLDMEADFFYCLGHSHSERGDPQGAIASYRRALEADPDLEQVHYNLALLYAAEGDAQRTRHHYAEALRIEPGFARAHNNLGSLLYEEGRMEEAAERFAAAARLEPDWAPAQRNLARALLALGRSQEALAPLDRAIGIDPGVAEDHFLRGSAHLQAGRLPEALAELTRAVEMAGEPRYHNELGTALLGAGRPGEAVTEFRAAIAKEPRYREAYNNAGAALAMLGDLAGAREYLEQAVARDPAYVDARFNLAAVLARLGERRLAAAELRRVLELQPDHPAARRRLAALGEP